MYLYLLRNTVNGKGYVGITSGPLRRRMLDHYAKANGQTKTLIAKAIRKYGREAFTITLLDQAATWEELIAMECAAIQTYDTFHQTGHGYNLTLGGDGTLGWRHADEAKTRMGAQNKGRVLSQAHRDAVSKAHKGIPKSPATRAKMSAHQRGAGNHRFGTHPSEATRQKLSAARQGRTPMLGKQQSAETRAKIAAWNQEHGNPRERPIELDGVSYRSISAAVRLSGLTNKQVRYRLKTGRAQYLDKDNR